jgi:hypothetical protein
MQKWIPFEGKCVTGDVLRWKQPIWSDEGPKRSKKKKVTRLGERRVTAAVLTVDSKDFIRLSVMKDEILENKFGMPLKTFKKDDVIVKKRATIAKGSPERLEWSDESVRSRTVSRFLR